MGKLRNELEDIDDRDDVVDNIKYMSSIKRKIIKWCMSQITNFHRHFWRQIN